MWACCLKRVYEEKCWRGIPSEAAQIHTGRVPAQPMGTISQHKATVLVDLPTNAAGAPFNLLPSSVQTQSLTSPVNTSACPPWGCAHLFCVDLRQNGRQLGLLLAYCWLFLHTPMVV